MLSDLFRVRSNPSPIFLRPMMCAQASPAPSRSGFTISQNRRDHRGTPALPRPQKITFAEMREAGVRGLLIYCSDYKCSRSIAISGGRKSDT